MPGDIDEPSVSRTLRLVGEAHGDLLGLCREVRGRLVDLGLRWAGAGDAAFEQLIARWDADSSELLEALRVFGACLHEAEGGIPSQGLRGTRAPGSAATAAGIAEGLDVGSAARALKARVVEVERALAAVRPSWTRAVEKSFEESRARWTHASADLSNLLADVGRTVGAFSSGYPGQS